MNELSLTQIAIELLHINENFIYYVNNPKKTRVRDFELITFEQVWGNTSGGFEGIGGSAMTSQRTYVFIPFDDDEKCLVFFGGRFAYHADYCEAFKEDLARQQLVGVSKKGKYINK